MSHSHSHHHGHSHLAHSPGYGRALSLTIALAGVARGIEPDHVDSLLAECPGVARVRHLHIWPTSTTETALTAHLVVPEGFPGDRFLANLRHEVAHRFRISQATFQVELRRD